MTFYEPTIYTQADLALLDNDEVVYPYSDEYATYLGRYHQYELTRKYFEERGISLEKELSGSSPTKIQEFLSWHFGGWCGKVLKCYFSRHYFF